MQQSTFFSLLIAGLASAAVPRDVVTWPDNADGPHWVVADFTSTQQGASFTVTFDGVYDRNATCSGAINQDDYQSCEGTLDTKWMLWGASLSLSTNMTQNNAEGLLYSIDNGTIAEISATETTFNVPLQRSQDFYAE